ncbi:phage integrase Arm DNA-binding domain-containing protein [Pseudomonas sp. PDM33]|nr:phage integrase Arm DNA-binding domain-containing protein [Pseudomonas sp. PDM33]
MNRSLPQSLYFDSRRGSYRYRRAADGMRFQFGKDRLKAVGAAKQLNPTFMEGADLLARLKAWRWVGYDSVAWLLPMHQEWWGCRKVLLLYRGRRGEASCHLSVKSR